MLNFKISRPKLTITSVQKLVKSRRKCRLFCNNSEVLKTNNVRNYMRQLRR